MAQAEVNNSSANTTDTTFTTTTEIQTSPMIDYSNLFLAATPEHEDHCKENKLRIKIKRTSLFSKKGKMKC